MAAVVLPAVPMGVSRRRVRFVNTVEARFIDPFARFDPDERRLEPRVAIAREKQSARDMDRADYGIGGDVVVDVMSGCDFDDIACGGYASPVPRRAGRPEAGTNRPDDHRFGGYRNPGKNETKGGGYR